MMSKIGVVQLFLSQYSDPAYLEVSGYDDGSVFALVASSKTLVVPSSNAKCTKDNEETSATEIFLGSSQEYFYQIEEAKRFDVICLDGIHTLEQTFKDLQGAMQHLSRDGVIIIDDVVPNSYEASLPDVHLISRLRAKTGSSDRSWMGDVYKLVFLIQGYFQHYSYATVAEGSGQLVMWKSRRAPHGPRALKFDQITQLQYSDVLDRQQDFNFRPADEIVGAVRAMGLPAIAASSAAAACRSLAFASAEQKRARQATWLSDLLFDDGHKVIADAETYNRTDFLCSNYDDLGVYAKQDLKNWTVNTSVRAASINAYAFEDVALLPHGVLCVGDEIIEETFRPAAPDYFRKDVEEYYNMLSTGTGLKEQTHHIETPLLIIEQPGMFNYGHFVVEMTPKLLAFRGAIERGDLRLALPIQFKGFGNVQSVLSFLGMTDEHVVWFDLGSGTSGRVIRARKLVCVSPVSSHLNSPYKAPWVKRVLGEMASKVHSGSDKRIFVSRQDASARYLINEDAIFANLEKIGYKKIRAGDLTFDQQIGAFKGATHIVGVYGASLSNLIFCTEGAKTLLLCPSNSVDHFYWDLASLAGVSYAQVVGSPAEGEENNRYCNFSVKEEIFLDALADFDPEHSPTAT